MDESVLTFLRLAAIFSVSFAAGITAVFYTGVIIYRIVWESTLALKQLITNSSEHAQKGIAATVSSHPLADKQKGGYSQSLHSPPRTV